MKQQSVGFESPGTAFSDMVPDVDNGACTYKEKGLNNASSSPDLKYCGRDLYDDYLIYMFKNSSLLDISFNYIFATIPKHFSKTLCDFVSICASICG
jgi:hypothetical protein